MYGFEILKKSFGLLDFFSDFFGFFWIFLDFSGFFSGFVWVYEDFMNKKDLNTEIEVFFTPKKGIRILNPQKNP